MRISLPRDQTGRGIGWGSTGGGGLVETSRGVTYGGTGHKFCRLHREQGQQTLLVEPTKLMPCISVGMPFVGFAGVPSLMNNTQIITSTWCKEDYMQLLLVLRGYLTWWKTFYKLCLLYVKKPLCGFRGGI